MQPFLYFIQRKQTFVRIYDVVLHFSLLNRLNGNGIPVTVAYAYKNDLTLTEIFVFSPNLTRDVARQGLPGIVGHCTRALRVFTAHTQGVTIDTNETQRTLALHN